MVDTASFLRESEAMLGRLYQTAYYVLRARQDAEDAVQQGLMKAWAARGSARPDTFRAWLSRIVVNECRNIQRHRMRVVPSEMVAPKDEAWKPPDPDLAEAVERLPKAIRVPFVLKYVACLTEREVAEAMRVPVSTVKNRLARARKLLRDALADWEVTFE